MFKIENIIWERAVIIEAKQAWAKKQNIVSLKVSSEKLWNLDFQPSSFVATVGEVRFDRGGGDTWIRKMMQRIQDVARRTYKWWKHLREECRRRAERKTDAVINAAPMIVITTQHHTFMNYRWLGAGFYMRCHSLPYILPTGNWPWYG